MKRPPERRVIWVYLFVSVVALTAAFVAQLVFPPQRRTRIILAAAAGPSTLLFLAQLISAIFIELDLTWFQTAVTLAFWFVSFMFVGLLAAIVGSELASLSIWLRARNKKPR